MAFVIKAITNSEEDYIPPIVFRTKIKLGAAADNDIVIPDSGILSYHCEIYPYANEHRIVGINSARILINEKEPEQWPVSLNDGDILTLSTVRYKFHILHETMRRSWRASFSSTVSLILLALLLIFEVMLILWLPYHLKNQKEATLSTMKQEIYLYLDNLRNQTRGINTEDKPEMVSVKNLLLNIEDDIAAYIRKYRDVMRWDETRTIYRDLHSIGNIVDTWGNLKDLYSAKLFIDPQPFINSMADKLKINTAPGSTSEGK